MTKQVISHRRPLRKRSNARARLGLLVVTFAALGAATWLAPYVYRPPPPPLETPQQSAMAPQKAPNPAGKDGLAQATGAPAAELAPATQVAGRPVRRHRHVTATQEPLPVYEPDVLTAAELDAISQARN